MNKSEIHGIKDHSSDITTVIGYLPRISLDVRIRCPRMFDAKNLPPSPPTLRYSEIAGQAAQKVMGAIWSYRMYVEVIKIGYILAEDTPDKLFITAEIVIVVPTLSEKIVVNSRMQIGFRSHFRSYEMKLDLADETVDYDGILKNLADNVARESVEKIGKLKDELFERIDQVKQFQIAMKQMEP